MRSTITRRRFLSSLASASAAATLPAWLASCDPEPPRRRSFDWDDWWDERSRTGVVDFANWPYYIDRRRDGGHPSLELFTEETGIRVDYTRPIRDNAGFLERIRPALEAGESTGYDLIVVTNGPELDELIERGWLVPLDRSLLPNFDRHAGPLVRDPAWDPGNRFTLAWQSGFTGIAYRPEAIDALGRRPDSIRDLWHPLLAGRVGMLVDLMDLGSFGLLAIGVDPETSTRLDWISAAYRLRQQRDNGILRGYYDQGYLRALQGGEIWACQAWSGDIFQANQLGHPELRFVLPTDGAMLWTDNMAIPANAEHPVDASLLMDFVYQPRVAAMIADWVWYVCPVPDAQPIVEDELGHPEVANSRLVFPNPERLLAETEETGADDAPRLRTYRVFADAAERSRWTAVFGDLIAAT